jgi:hypothetical protein
MLSYPIPEAEELLANKLSAAQQSLSNCEEDMDFLREQVTVRCMMPSLSDSHIYTSSIYSPSSLPLQPAFKRKHKTDLRSLSS